METAIQVAVIDREGFYIEAVMAVLKQQPDLNVIASATIFDDFVAEARDAEVVVVQQETVKLTNELLDLLSNDLPDADLVVIGAAKDKDIIIGYIEHGALGYVCEDEDFDQLLQVIRVVRRGQALAHPGLIAPLYRRLAELSRLWRELYPVDSGEVALTARQRQVTELLAQGHSNAEIAEALSISIGTVKNHVHKVFQRLGVGSREQAAIVYARITESAESDPG